jgi:hypothetical protein
MTLQKIAATENDMTDGFISNPSLPGIPICISVLGKRFFPPLNDQIPPMRYFFKIRLFYTQSMEILQ